MKKFSRFPSFVFFPLTGAFLLVCLTACQKELSSSDDAGVQNVTLRFHPIVDGEDLIYGQPYVNAAGETYSVRAFKFYVSAVQLVSSAGSPTTPAGYFLIDFSDTAAVTVPLQGGASQYNKISFTVGVDSVRNVSGVQTGALDPAAGMFWTWNSGYIMAKLEGYSPQSNQPNNLFEYHIGGFRKADNVVQTVTLDLPANQTIDTRSGKKSEVNIVANVNQWFEGPNPISIATVPACMTPGTLAQQIAANYLRMFTVNGVTNQ